MIFFVVNMDGIRKLLFKFAGDHDGIVENYAVKGRSGVRHRLDYMVIKGGRRVPVRVARGDIYIEISILKIICYDIDAEEGILIANSNDISEDINKLALQHGITIIKT